MNPKKISRICWNTNGWEKPSGLEGKSRNKSAFERKNAFGHEEWLFDLTKIIKGFHYGFLETINKYREKYTNEIFDISLYSINSSTKEKFWIGEIKNCKILSKDEGADTFKKYSTRKWLKEMIGDVKRVNGKITTLKKSAPENFFNLKFKISDLKLLREPMLIAKSDMAIKAYYYTLLNKKTEPKFADKADGVFKFKPGLILKKERTYRSHRKFSKSVELEHNKIQEKLYNCLCKLYGRKNVGTENSTGFGSRIDLVVKNKSKYTFYELKTGVNLLSNVRDALSQLLEYTYYPNRKNAEELIIISLMPISKEVNMYLNSLREKFRIPIYYKQFDVDKSILN